MVAKFKRLLVGVLYSLPVIFFCVCYFLISATEEDIAQGAHTAPDVWNDLVAAFQNNARLADMYAWAVINFFDYQYSFGVDTIFRLIDVVGAIGMLLLLASVILGHKPRWQLKDALAYLGMFLLIILTPYGYTFYRGFSMIHNYLIIALAMLGFCLPFIRKLSDGNIPKLYKKWWICVPMGLVFGLSANFPPLAFLATYIILKIWQLWQAKRRGQDLRKILPETWEWCMIGGMLASMAVGYILGPGVSGYATDPVYTVSYDYVALGDILQNFGGSVARIFKHIVVNFGRVLLPISVALVIGGSVVLIRAKVFGKKLSLLPKDAGQKKLLVGLIIFSVFATLAGSQIIMPIRLCLLAYLALSIATIILMKNWWQDLPHRSLIAVTSLLVILAVAVIGVRGVLAWDFHERVGVAFDTIREAEEETVCINPAEFQQHFSTPFNIFQQEETFVLRRTTPAKIYDKNVVYCEAAINEGLSDLNKFYHNAVTVGYKDIRELSENYNLEQAQSDDCFVIGLTMQNVSKYDKFMNKYQDGESAFVRVAQSTIEGDTLITDVLYDAASDMVYLVRDYSRDKFSAGADRVIEVMEYKHAGEYQDSGKIYLVVYNGELPKQPNAEYFADSERVFIVGMVRQSK